MKRSRQRISTKRKHARGTSIKGGTSHRAGVKQEHVKALKLKPRNAVAAAVSLALGSTLAAQDGIAQERAAQEDMEEVIVTGIRGSLASSADLKSSATGIVDAITAEDIGRFPDTNLAESLQRITGVSIDRTRNEGNQVTVRGFGPNFNLVTLNNRSLPNSSAFEFTGITRSFNFRELSSESVRAVEVYKTGRAHVPTGGVGATINIRTSRPSDFDGLTAHLSTTGIMDTSVKNGDNITPEISGMVSNTFQDGQFGVLASFSHSDRQFGVDRIGASINWSSGYPGQANPDTSAIDAGRNPTGTTWRVPTVDLDVADYQRERQNAQIAFEFTPNDAFTGVIDYTMSRIDEAGSMNRMSFWFDNVERGAADANGTIINPERDNDELNFWAWEYGFKTENDSFGINLEWQATDSLAINFDAHNSTSHANPGALPAERLANLKNPFGAAAPVTIRANFSGKLPTVSYDDSALPGTGAYDRMNIEADLYQERGYETENNIQQVQLHGHWANQEDGGLIGIRFGVAHTTYKVDTIKIAGSSFALGNGAMDISGLNYTFIPGDIGFEYIPQYSALEFIRMVEEQGLKNPANKDHSGIEEISLALYLGADFETSFNDMGVRTNVGIRYEDTNVSSYSVGRPVVGFNWNTPLEMSKVFGDAEVSDTLDGGYNSFLPNIDFSLDIRDDVIARVSFSRTISRSTIGAMFPNTNLTNHLSTGPFLASQGNPDLLPFESDNLDFSLEWYYTRESYASVGFFYKKVDNFIASAQQERTINGPNGPLTNPSVNPRGDCPTGSVAEPVAACLSQPGDPVIDWTVTTSVNLNETEVNGWEFNIQHIFAETGFGGIINFTVVDSDDTFDIHSLDNSFAIEGLSNSANLVAFYEKGQWSVRLAYNWRDMFLLAGGGGGEPKFVEAYGQLDFSASYRLNDRVSFYVDGININDETTHRYGRFENQLYDYEEYGPRYSISAKIKL